MKKLKINNKGDGEDGGDEEDEEDGGDEEVNSKFYLTCSLLPNK
ncbi:hypothetical protein [Coleofasciculus sp.]